MIDLDGLEFEIKCVPDNECALFTKDEAFELITRLRQAEKDAARYRWVVNQFWFQDEASWRLNIKDSELSAEFHDDVSAAIDEAMQCSK